MADTLKKNALLDACINNNVDIFQEIKKQRRVAPTISNIIDGVTNNVESHFASIYKQVYNSVDDQSELFDLTKHLSDCINPSNINNVLRISPSLVREAITRPKNNKSDPLFEFNSDCLKNGPSVLFEQLAMLFRHYLIHGHISSVLTLFTLVPIIKDKLGDIRSSNNYRSIAISSLILKIFDWVILLLHGNELNIDELQFGFQRNTSTNMCTWLAVEIIEYFQRNGSEVFACAVDMTKAFDQVKHSTLFWKLIEKGLPSIYIRLLLIMYGYDESIRPS